MKKLITKLGTEAEYTRQKVVRSEVSSRIEWVIFLKAANSQRQFCRIGQIRVRSSVVKLALRNGRQFFAIDAKQKTPKQAPLGERKENLTVLFDL